MISKVLLGLVGAYVVGAAVWLAAGGVVRDQAPTRAAQRLLRPDARTVAGPQRAVHRRLPRRTRRQRLTIKQSHGGSGSQARAVIDGLEADVVTLALWSDTDAIRKRGLIDDGWEERLPNGSLPYFSTIVFVVRKGNPKGIKDWPDLVKPGVEIITPNPKTSGNGKLELPGRLGRGRGARGGRRTRPGLRDEALPAGAGARLGARGATTTFAQKKIGDVHLTWENEAHLEVRRERTASWRSFTRPSASGPSRPWPWSMPTSARRDAGGGRGVPEVPLHRRGPGDHRQALLPPVRPEGARAAPGQDSRLPNSACSRSPRSRPSWDDANEQFFAEGAVFDRIYAREKK